MSPFERFRYHVVDDDDVPATAAPPTAFQAEVPSELAGLADSPFTSDEAAARFYLDAVFRREDRVALQALVAPERAEKVPSLELVEAKDVPLTRTRLARFRQTQASIPVFGASATVELTPERELIALDCHCAHIEGVSPTPQLSVSDAIAKVEDFAGVTVPREGVVSALNWFVGEDGSSHLAWLLRDLPAPESDSAPSERRGLGAGPRDVEGVDYLVDAHDGDVLYHYSGVARLDAPTSCTGRDEKDREQRFWGRLERERYLMDDPLRQTRTFDYAYADIESAPPPASPIASAQSDWREENRAGVSAHVNAMLVHDFYKTVLQRNSLDDHGMELKSAVNCTYRPAAGTRDWNRAMWWRGQMWYGQVTEGGRLVSMARHLDVIAHELTHGVIEFSSALLKKGEPGALNESFCDIMGVIIRNHYLARAPADVGTWSWEIAPGFMPDGGPLRDVSDPGRAVYPFTGEPYPDNYSRRYTGTDDDGGVHINNNIHNKAAYNLLTMAENGQRVFTVEEATVLFYLGMTRVVPQATFSDSLQTLTHVAKTYYSGEPAERDRKLAAIARAYSDVGIT